MNLPEFVAKRLFVEFLNKEENKNKSVQEVMEIVKSRAPYYNLTIEECMMLAKEARK